MNPTFTIHRIDGRSNAQVVLDTVKGCDPGRLFTYDELIAALGTGTDRVYTVRDVRQIIGAVYPRLLREQQRAIHAVRGQGYRIALASEQTGLALGRKRRADVQLHRGLQTLQQVRWDELDPIARKTHEGTLMVVGALWQQQRALERRQSEVERAIAGLTARVEAIAAK